MADWMNDYLDAVRAQLRWKLARPVVLRELESHLQDQFEAYINDGLDENQAQAETIRQMGDPVAVGKELDRVHRPKNAWEIIAAMALLMVCGLCLWVFLFYRVSGWSLNHWLWTPLGAMGIGLALFVIFYRFDMNAAAKRPWWLYGAGLLLMVLGLLCSDQLGGVNYWGQYTAMLLPLCYGGAVYALRGKGIKGLVLCGTALLPMLLLAGFTRNTWNLLRLYVSAAVMLLLANCNGVFGESKKRNGSVIAATMTLVLLGCVGANRKQIQAMMRPLLYDGIPEAFRRNYIQSLLAHSRPIGPGSAFKLEHLSHEITTEALLMEDVLSTDFLLAGVSYLCGWVVALMLLLAALLLLALLLRRGLKQRTLWGKMIACAVIVPMLLQTVGYTMANLGYSVGSFELPLLSYGGAYKVVDLTLLGILLGTFRCRTILREEQPNLIDKKILTLTR